MYVHIHADTELATCMFTAMTCISSFLFLLKAGMKAVSSNNKLPQYKSHFDRQLYEK